MNFEKIIVILKVLLFYILPVWFGIICGMIIAYQAYLQEDKTLACAGGVVTAMIIVGVHVCVKSIIEWGEARNIIKNADY
jgi:hypothetical protein